jgi:hypothetical protein
MRAIASLLMPKDTDSNAFDTGMRSDQDLPDALYHYTDINGLQGIWESGHLWATGSRFLNDTSELRLGVLLIQSRIAQRQTVLLEENIDALKRAIQEREAEQQSVSDAFIEEIKLRNAPELAELQEIKGAAEDAEKYMVSYIACLTERDDQLSQWRGYAREGYCVGFDTKLLLDSLDARVMRRVYYSDETEDEAYAARMIEVAKQHRKVMLGQPELADEIDEEGRRWIMGIRLTTFAAFMKDSHFDEEMEVRIVQVNGSPDLFTPHRYGMVPRIVIPLPDNCIRSVRVGPSAHDELKRRSLFDYFRGVRFKKREGEAPAEELTPDVLKSTIPFRDW